MLYIVISPLTRRGTHTLSLAHTPTHPHTYHDRLRLHALRPPKVIPVVLTHSSAGEGGKRFPAVWMDLVIWRIHLIYLEIEIGPHSTICTCLVI
mmetsp:Transcript_74001/g.120154  ORF Transcript_74001/g.120154 Transcript_74001/m.120154 type:complete len:94 (-) Transcript_74001:53-334(-)